MGPTQPRGQGSGGRGLLARLCPPSTPLVRDTGPGTPFPRVGFPAVPRWWKEGHCQTARPRRPESHQAGNRWDSDSKRADRRLSDRGRGAGVFAGRPPVAARFSTLHAGSGLLARGADFPRGPAAHASARPGVSFRSRAVLDSLAQDPRGLGVHSKSHLYKTGPQGGPWRHAAYPGAAGRAHTRPGVTEPTGHFAALRRQPAPRAVSDPQSPH